MSRERNSGKSNNRNSDRRPSSPKSSKPSFDKPKRARGTDTPKRGGERTFDSREKYEKGDLKFGKKPFKKFDKDDDRAKSFVQKRRLDKLSKSDNKETIRLNKYIANSGICSRREADDLITQGLVEVNGKVVTEMGYQVQKTDRVVFDGQGITPEIPASKQTKRLHFYYKRRKNA